MVKLHTMSKEEALYRQTESFIDCFPGHTTFVCQSTENNKFYPYNQPLHKSYRQLKQNNDNRFNIYFTVNETNSSGRKAENIESIRAIFADDDKPRNTPQKFPLEPSIITRTSGNEKEGYKHQYYWLTETEDYKTWERVLRGIIAVYDTDQAVHDLSRILRVPGFYNYKYNPPEMCETILLTGTRYEWETILDNFPPMPESEVKEQKALHEDDRLNLQKIMERFKDPVESGYITNSINSLICHWAWHYSATKIEEMVDDLFMSVPPETLQLHQKRYYAARGQVKKFIASAKKTVTLKQNRELVGELEDYDEVPENLTWDWSVLKSNKFTDSCVPPYLLDAATEVGEWNGIGKEPAVVSAMAICSALLNKNVIIHETYNQLTHFCAQGTIIVMDTGASKSSIYEAMNAPFFEYEDSVQEEWEKNKNIYFQKVKQLEQVIKKRDTKFNKQSDPTENELEEHILANARDMDKIDKIPVKRPSLHTNDITEESIFRKMLENNGKIALISDDARKPINILLGEYKKGSDTGEAIYISGFSGTTIVRERSSGDEQRIKRPVLNCLYFVQPDTAIKLRNSDMYVPSGLAARMPLYFYPTDGVDIVKNRKRRDINHAKMQPYYSHLRALCNDRSDRPLHIRLSEEGMQRCKKFDIEFARMLEGQWHGEMAKLNKLVSTSLQYATCIAALDDPEFKFRFMNPGEFDDEYYLSVKYMNMGFEYAKILFHQSVTTQNTVQEEGIPRKAKSFVNSLMKLYEKDRIYEGFVNQGDFRNHFSVSYRDDLPQIIEFLTSKKWLFITRHKGEKRKLNSGFPNKLVDEGDIIWHLNIKGIKKRGNLQLDKIEDKE